MTVKMRRPSSETHQLFQSIFIVNKPEMMSSLDMYVKESGEMVARLGFWSEEFRRFRDWWQQNMDRATVEDVRRMAERIRRDAGCR